MPCATGDVTKDPSLRRLPGTFREATEMMAAKDSFARRALGNAFVDHFAMTRMNEVAQYERAVTDWELRRYFETV
ncbi:MAG: hypothetical protein BJ554DRAFT_3114 [Olpidium bornovanus]|uniref:GS catalytic domain-containing protein n=1 Tax=Olpidium bornovanus TaxID=278681 RepID=A0A8H7ZPC2_9FUNG|nr:MAG: hypothetical protein BJ554DRAFT_3114 [Olpidium bornovanus]